MKPKPKSSVVPLRNTDVTPEIVLERFINGYDGDGPTIKRVVVIGETEDGDVSVDWSHMGSRSFAYLTQVLNAYAAEMVLGKIEYGCSACDPDEGEPGE